MRVLDPFSLRRRQGLLFFGGSRSQMAMNQNGELPQKWLLGMHPHPNDVRQTVPSCITFLMPLRCICAGHRRHQRRIPVGQVGMPGRVGQLNQLLVSLSRLVLLRFVLCLRLLRVACRCLVWSCLCGRVCLVLFVFLCLIVCWFVY